MALQVVGGCIIPAGESISNPVDCSGCTRLVRIIVPDEWSMAPITFQLSPDGGVFSELYNVTLPGDAYRVYPVVVPNPRAGSTITLPAEAANGINFIKVRSGTPAAPVPQPMDCEFAFVAKFPDPAPAPTAR